MKIYVIAKLLFLSLNTTYNAICISVLSILEKATNFIYIKPIEKINI